MAAAGEPQDVKRRERMNEVPPDGAALVGNMADAEESVRQNTRELLWWGFFAVIGGLFVPSGNFLTSGAILLLSAWVLRRHKATSVGVGLCALLTVLTLHGAWRVFHQQTAKGWIDVVFVGLVTLQVMDATDAARRYRQLWASFQEHFGAQDHHVTFNTAAPVGGVSRFEPVVSGSGG